MRSMCQFRWILVAFVLIAGGAPLSGQAPRFLKPERLERPVEVDADGKQQWAEWPAPQCPSCKGAGKLKCATCERYPDEAKKCPDCERKEKREAVCHTCAGQGKIPDPLDHALCPGCQGAGKILCGCCPGSGILKLGDGATRWSDCIGCRGDGWIECMLCDGKRLVGMVEVKPSLREAEAEDLADALKDVDETLQAVSAFDPAGERTRKAVKKLESAIKKGRKVMPVLKKSPKLIKELMKMTYAGSNFQGQEEREAQSMNRIKATHEYYLQHQKRMLELALQRAQFNEKLEAGK